MCVFEVILYLFEVVLDLFKMTLSLFLICKVTCRSFLTSVWMFYVFLRSSLERYASFLRCVLIFF